MLKVLYIFKTSLLFKIVFLITAAETIELCDSPQHTACPSVPKRAPAGQQKWKSAQKMEDGGASTLQDM